MEARQRQRSRTHKRCRCQIYGEVMYQLLRCDQLPSLMHYRGHGHQRLHDGDDDATWYRRHEHASVKLPYSPLRYAFLVHKTL